MLTMNCDRCGREIPREEFEQVKDAGGSSEYVRISNVVHLKLGSTTLRADLCGVCQNTLKTNIASVMEGWPVL